MSNPPPDNLRAPSGSPQQSANSMFTSTIMSDAEAKALPLRERPLNHRISSEIYHAVFEAIGAASMCWNPTPSGIFHSSAAERIAVALCFKIANDNEGRTETELATARAALAQCEERLKEERSKCSDLFNTAYDYSARLKAAEAKLAQEVEDGKHLREALERVREIDGYVYVPPSDWNSFKMGRHATLDDCEKIDLSDFIDAVLAADGDGNAMRFDWKPASRQSVAIDSNQLPEPLSAATKQISTIEDFLRGRKYCTELYISPLGFNGGEAWQVELNWGDGQQAFQGESVAHALGSAMVAAMQRHAAMSALPAVGPKEQGAEDAK